MFTSTPLLSSRDDKTPEAKKWQNEFDSLGDPLAYLAGISYEHGKLGFEKDGIKAIECYYLAAQQSHSDALLKLQELAETDFKFIFSALEMLCGDPKVEKIENLSCLYAHLPSEALHAAFYFYLITDRAKEFEQLTKIFKENYYLLYQFAELMKKRPDDWKRIKIYLSDKLCSRIENIMAPQEETYENALLKRKIDKLKIFAQAFSDICQDMFPSSERRLFQPRDDKNHLVEIIEKLDPSGAEKHILSVVNSYKDHLHDEYKKNGNPHKLKQFAAFMGIKFFTLSTIKSNITVEQFRAAMTKIYKEKNNPVRFHQLRITILPEDKYFNDRSPNVF